MPREDSSKTAEPPLVSVLLPTHNRADSLRQCLDALVATNYPRLEIVVIIAASTDHTLQVLAEFSGQVKVLQIGDVGYGESINHGIESSAGELVASLEDDYEVDADWLTPLVEAMLKDDSIGVTGGTVLFHQRPEIVLAAGGQINTITGDTRSFGTWETEAQGRAEPSDVDYVPVPLVRRTVYDAIGLWDPEYFVLFDESDMCLRAKRAGFRVQHVPGSRVWHKVPPPGFWKSSTKRLYYYFRNRTRFVLIHAPGALLSLGLLYNLGLNLLVSLGFLFRGERRKVSSLWNAFKWNVEKIQNAVEARRRLSRQSPARRS